MLAETKILPNLIQIQEFSHDHLLPLLDIKNNKTILCKIKEIGIISTKIAKSSEITSITDVSKVQEFEEEYQIRNLPTVPCQGPPSIAVIQLQHQDCLLGLRIRYLPPLFSVIHISKIHNTATILSTKMHFEIQTSRS